MRLLQSRLAILVCLTLGFAACGGESGSSLSPVGPSRSSSGATIAGQILTTAPPVASRTLDVPDSVSSTMDTRGPITITVVGTGVKTSPDNQGQFTLTNVPAGTVQLNFTGPDSNATITIDGVKEGDDIQISVRVNGNSAKVESERRSNKGKGNENGNQNGNGNGEFVGRIASIDSGAKTFVVSGTTIKITSTTVIRHGSRTVPFSDLKVGDQVQVRGTRDGSTITASEIKVEDDDDDDEDEDRNNGDNEVKGTISSLNNSNCPNATFTIGNISITANSSTKYEDGSCSTLKNGTRVEVTGSKQANGSITATRIEFD